MNYIDPSSPDSVKSRGFVSGSHQKPKLSDQSWDDPSEDLVDEIKPYTRAELEAKLGKQILRPSAITVKRLLMLQMGVTLISVIAWSAIGKPFALDSAAISAFFGGLAAFLPAALFAMRAQLITKKAGGSGAAIFALVTGELLKIIATVAIFISAVLLYADLKWLPMLLTYVLALKCYLLVWVVRK